MATMESAAQPLWPRVWGALRNVLLGILLVIPAGIGFLAGACVTIAMWTVAAVRAGYDEGRGKPWDS